MYGQGGNSPRSGQPQVFGYNNDPPFGLQRSGTSRKQRVRAMYSFQGENPGDLSFEAGDIIEVVTEGSTSGPEWWRGELRGRRGSFPLNHVEMLKAIESPPVYPLSPAITLPKPTSYNTPPPGGLPTAAQTSVSSYTLGVSPYRGTATGMMMTDDTDLKYKIGIFMGVVNFIFIMFALFVPWYFSFIPGGKMNIYQWSGISAYDLGTVNQWFAMLNTGTGYTPYVVLGFNNVNSVMAISVTFEVLTFVANVILMVLFYLRLRDSYRKKTGTLGSGFHVVGIFCNFTVAISQVWTSLCIGHRTWCYCRSRNSFLWNHSGKSLGSRIWLDCSYDKYWSFFGYVLCCIVWCQ